MFKKMDFKNVKRTVLGVVTCGSLALVAGCFGSGIDFDGPVAKKSTTRKFLIVNTTQQPGKVFSFEIVNGASASGRLNLVSKIDNNYGGTSEGIVTTNNGRCLYVSSNSEGQIDVYQIDVNGVISSRVQRVATTGAAGGATAGAVTPDDSILMMTATGDDSIFSYRIDNNINCFLSGPVTRLANAGVIESPVNIAVSPNGLFGVNSNFDLTGSNGVTSFSITSSGGLVYVATGVTNAADRGQNVKMAPNGQFVLLANRPGANTGREIEIFPFNQQTGVLGARTDVPVGVGQNMTGIAIAPSGLGALLVDFTVAPANINGIYGLTFSAQGGTPNTTARQEFSGFDPSADQNKIVVDSEEAFGVVTETAQSGSGFIRLFTYNKDTMNDVRQTHIINLSTEFTISNPGEPRIIKITN